jgi:hypothetical protein
MGGAPNVEVEKPESQMAETRMNFPQAHTASHWLQSMHVREAALPADAAAACVMFFGSKAPLTCNGRPVRRDKEAGNHSTVVTNSAA